MLSKLIARRLEVFLPGLIKPDQTGFIRNRFSHPNVRRLLNVIQYAHSSQERILCVALDAAKAFDRVEFDYLFEVLRRFGLGPEFIKWIRLLYSAPMASVLVNGCASEAFHLGRGTRQGCPLSPLLFALAIEPLAEAIRSVNDISGVHLGGTVHKLALYADDIILFLTEPEISIPALVSTIEAFGSFSGYRINYDKSEALPLGDFGSKSALINFPFKWSESSFTYLGVRISANLNELYKLNFTPILSLVKSDLLRWFDLPLSLLGRISLIKMNVLPRILYPMQMLPLRINKSVFCDINKVISKFIWHGKKPRLNFKTLQLPRERGGLSLPNFMFYNWACHARIVSDWLRHFLNSRHETHIDSWHCPSLSLLSLVSGEKSPLPAEVKGSPLMMNTIKTWERIRKFTRRTGPFSALHPIIQNKAFPPGMGANIFQCWYDHGIKLVSDLFEADKLLSFAQIRAKFDIPSKHFYGFLQVRRFINNLNFPETQPVASAIHSFLLQSYCGKKFISLFYGKLQSLNTFNIDRIRGIWGRDLENDVDEEAWSDAVELVGKVFLCNRLTESQYRILHRLHPTPQSLNAFYPGVSPLCVKCKKEVESYMHCIWKCPLIFTFWEKVSQELDSILGKKIQINPGLLLLNLPSDRLTLSHAQQRLLNKLLLLARRCILFQWIKPRPPTVNQWYGEIFKVLPMERLCSVLKGNERTFDKLWAPFLNHLPDGAADLIYRGRCGVVWRPPWTPVNT